MNKQFNPAEVPINYTLNFAQVNLLLKGMGKLPREESEGFYEQFRGVLLQTLQAAEAAHNEAAAAEAARLEPPEVVEGVAE